MKQQKTEAVSLHKGLCICPLFVLLAAATAQAALVTHSADTDFSGDSTKEQEKRDKTLLQGGIP